MKTKEPMESQRLDRDEAIAGIRRGLAEADAGKGRPVRDAVLSIRNKHGISSPTEQNSEALRARTSGPYSAIRHR